MNRQMNPRDGNIINTGRGKAVKAPKKPFPWWGPFNGTDAIGRALILLGLSGLAILFATVVALSELAPFMRPALSSYFFSFGVLLNLARIIVLLVAGVGVLLRQRWGSILTRLLIVWVVIEIVYYVGKTLSFTGIQAEILPGLAAVIVFLLTISVPLWRHFSAPTVRYEYNYVSIDELRAREFDTAFIFSRAVAYFGCVLILLGLQILVLMSEMRMFGIPPLLILNCLALLIVGIALVIGAVLFRRRQKTGRIILRITSFLVFAWIVALVAYIVVRFGFVPSRADALGAEFLAGFVAPIFQFITPAYVAFESIRYFQGDVARAFCGEGRYTLPWQAQVDLLQEQENAQQPEIKPGE